MDRRRQGTQLEVSGQGLTRRASYTGHVPSPRPSKGSRPSPPPAAETADSLPVIPFDAEAFRRRLARWYAENARELPWRNIHDPYATWLSEIMLQQTRVATVIERYTAFLERFPSIKHLAAAPEADVLALWSGLGYYRRARMLLRGAQFVARELGGKLPSSSAALRTLPGIGDYTSAAIASIAFRESIAVVDGNVERVLLRVLGRAEDRSARARAEIAAVAQQLVPAAPSRRARGNPPGDHNQAMMELGATVCLPRSPLCLQCPVVDFCATRGEHATPERGKPQSRTVAFLLALRKRGISTEVLLERRPAEASLMPGMLELPPLPLNVVEDREPVLRLRHSITNTNYYVLLFSESAPGAPPSVAHDDEEDAPENAGPAEDAVFVAPKDSPAFARTLLASVPAAPHMLLWCNTKQLLHRPLTGLARKALQRMGVMAVPRPRIR